MLSRRWLIRTIFLGREDGTVAELQGKQCQAMQERTAWQQMHEAASFTNSALEWDGRPPVPCLLWQEAGHPSLPATPSLFDMEAKLDSLAALTRCAPSPAY